MYFCTNLVGTLYTAALLEYLEQPLEVGLLFRRVRAQVLASTGGEQRPHEYHSLLSEHYLSVPPTADSVTVVAAPAPVPDVAPVDVAQLTVWTRQRPPGGDTIGDDTHSAVCAVRRRRRS